MDYLTHNEIKYVQQHLEENIQLLKTTDRNSFTYFS